MALAHALNPNQIALLGVARILGLRFENDPEPSRGTGFLISPRHLLTSAHVVFEGGRPFPICTISLIGHRGVPDARAEIVRVLAHDFVEDWAVLECTVSPPVPYHRLMAKRTDRVETPQQWYGYGFPNSEPEAGKSIHGDITGWRFGTPEIPDLLQLFCREAAAGEPVAGCSGGPVFARREIVGLVRAVAADDDWEAMLAATLGRDRRDIATRALGGTIYATQIGHVLDAIARKGIEGIEVDHSWFKPQLPALAPPKEPFKDLRPYGEEDRDIYFGRDAAVRDLLKLLLSEQPPQLLLLHGPAGAGKSSLLAAGVVPYLRHSFEVQLETRRDRAADGRGGLIECLRDAAKHSRGRPLILVIDQVEYAFRDGFDAGRAEVRELLAAVREEFLHPSGINLRTLVLSYRKEWHAEISASAAGAPCLDYPLVSMSRDELAETVSSIERMLKEQYHASIDDGVFDQLAARVDGQEGAHAPVLQVLMTRLWREASESSGSAPPRISWQLFNSACEKMSLADYVGRQLAPSKEAKSTVIQAFEAGLGHAILRFHTSRTASRRRTRAELLDEFGERDGRTVAVLSELERAGLVLIDHGSQIARLVHDSLSPVVCAEHDRSLLPGQRGFRRLEARRNDRKPGEDIVYSEEERRAIREGLDGMALLSSEQLLHLFKSALRDHGDDIGFWYTQALTRHPADTLRALLLSQEVSSVGLVAAIAGDNTLRNEPQLRETVVRAALGMQKPADLRTIAYAIADNMLPFTDAETRLLQSASGETRSRAEQLSGWIALRRGKLPNVDASLRKRTHVAAGILFHDEASTELPQSSATRHTAGLTAIWLAIAFSALVPSWLHVLNWYYSVQSVGNLMPPVAWAMGSALLVGPWAFRRHVHGLATRSFRAAWRGFHAKFIAAVVPLFALIIGFAKAGAQVLVTSGDYSLRDGLGDFVISVSLACVATAALCAVVPLIPRVSTESAPSATWVLVRRYVVALLFAAGVPLLVAALLTRLLWIIPPSYQATLRLDAASSMGIYIALATGGGTILGAIAMGVQHGTELMATRRELLGPNAASVVPVRSQRRVFGLCVVLAIAGGWSLRHMRTHVGRCSFGDAPAGKPAGPGRCIIRTQRAMS